MLALQASYRLPYKWSRMSYERRADEHAWRSTRRWPGPAGTRANVRVRVGEPLTRPDPLAVFLTARWQLHTRLPTGRTAFVVAEHPPWRLFGATLLDLDEDVIAAAGLPAVRGVPHVLLSPGVTARIGPPLPISRRRE